MATESKNTKTKDIQGFKYFKKMSRVLEHLHKAGCERDRADNRLLHMDQYMSLLLLCMFSPICSSLRAMQQASELSKVQKKLGIPRCSLVSLSEAARVFDSELLKEVINELVKEVDPIPHLSKLEDVGGILTVVDGTVIKSLPTIVGSLCRDKSKKGFKSHMHYEVLKGAPVGTTVTDVSDSERQVLAEQLQPRKFYVLDRGYFSYKLMQQIINAHSSFVCRIQEQSTLNVIDKRELNEDCVKAGICRDITVLLGARRGAVLRQPLRVIELKCTESTSGDRVQKRRGFKKGVTMLLATDRFDLPAEVIALIYKCRWQIEVFFRFFKHILGCRYLLS